MTDLSEVRSVALGFFSLRIWLRWFFNPSSSFLSCRFFIAHAFYLLPGIIAHLEGTTVWVQHTWESQEHGTRLTGLATAGEFTAMGAHSLEVNKT
jgi:hypothetical protein